METNNIKKLFLLTSVVMIELTGCSSVHRSVPSGVLQKTVKAEHIEQQLKTTTSFTKN